MGFRKMMSDDDIVVWIERFVADRGYSPAVRELAAACGVVVSAAHVHIARLKQEGRLHYVPGIARTLRVTATEDER